MPEPSIPKPTQASPLPTMAAPSPARATAGGKSSPSSKRPLLLALAGLVVIGSVIVLGYFVWEAKRTRGQLATMLPSPTPTSQPSETPVETLGQSPGPTAKPTAATTPIVKGDTTSTPNVVPTATPSQSPLQSSSPLPPGIVADPVLFPPKEQTDYSKVFSIREVDQPARITSRPKPNYTEEARKNQVQGVVILRIVLGANGEVTKVTVMRGLPNGLSESAVASARQIKFEPARKDGRAVSQYATVEMNFSLY